jgi:hypothetical protein
MRTLLESILDDEDILISKAKNEATPQNTLINAIYVGDIDSIEALFRDILPKGGYWEITKLTNSNKVSYVSCDPHTFRLPVIKIEYYINTRRLFIEYNKLTNNNTYKRIFLDYYKMSNDDYNRIKRLIAKKFNLKKYYDTQNTMIWTLK